MRKQLSLVSWPVRGHTNLDEHIKVSGVCSSALMAAGWSSVIKWLLYYAWTENDAYAATLMQGVSSSFSGS